MTDDRRPRSKRDDVRTASSELREYARGALDVEHDDVPDLAGIVRDDDLRDVLLFAEQAYERHSDAEDPEFRETQWASNLVDPAAAESATTAIEDGNLSQIEYLTGLPEYENDVSGLNTVRKLENWLVHKEQTRLIYLAGLMGRGKTDWALSMLSTVYWVHKRLREDITNVGGSVEDVPRPEFAANFRVDPAPEGVECKHIDNYDDIVEWGEQGSSDDVRWFVFDEASTELTAQSGENAQTVAELFAPFVKKMRKLGINMTVVGHDKGDVHVAIRSLADFVSKPGLKKAKVYAGIKNREPSGHIMDLDRIPETTWGYDTDDMATWSWGSAREEHGEGVDETTLKRMIAIRGATLVDEHGFSEEQAVETLNGGSVSISRYMIRKAREGDYNPTIA
jgi:hypothetical protein